MVKKLLCTILGTASLALSAQSDCLSGTSINEDFVGAIAPSELDGISIGYSGDQTGEYAFTRNSGDLSVVVNQPSGGWKPMGLSVAGGYLDLSGNSAVEVSLTNDGDLGIEVYFTFYSGASADKKLVSGTAEAAPYGGVIASGETKTYTFDVSTGKKRVWTGAGDCFSGGVKVGDICIGDAGFDVSEISLIEWTVNGAGYSDPDNGWTVPALVDYPISMHYIKAGTCGSTTDPDDETDPNGNGSACTDVSFTGRATYYNLIENGNTGKCSFLTSDLQGNDYGALDIGLLQENNDAAYCGMCVEATGSAGTAIVQVVDECPDCADRDADGNKLYELDADGNKIIIDVTADGNVYKVINTEFGDIDLAPQTFTKVIGALGVGVGTFSWNEVSCPWATPIKLLYESNEEWYNKVFVANSVNRVKSVEISNDGGSSWHMMTRIVSNGFEKGSFGQTTKSYKITDIYDEVVYINDVDVPNAGSFVLADSNFPACGLTTSTSRVNSLDYVTVFPNPSNNSVTFAGIEDVDKMEIINVNGQIVGSQTFQTSLEQVSLDVSNLAAGIYVAKMNGKNSSGTVTFVKK